MFASVANDSEAVAIVRKENQIDYVMIYFVKKNSTI